MMNSLFKDITVFTAWEFWVIPGIAFIVMLTLLDDRVRAKYEKRKAEVEENRNGSKVVRFFKATAKNAWAFLKSVNPWVVFIGILMDVGLCVMLSFSLSSTGVSTIFYGILIAMIIATVVLSWVNAVRFLSLVCCGGMICCFYKLMSFIWSNASWYSRHELKLDVSMDLLEAIPFALFLIGIGIICARYFYKSMRTVKVDSTIDEDYKGFWRFLYGAVALVSVAMIVWGASYFFRVSWESVPASANDGGEIAQQEESTTPATTTPATTEAVTTTVNADEATADSALAEWYKFRNLELQDDGIDGNDWNVGPDPTLSLTKEEKEELAADPDGFWHKKLKERGDEDLLVRALVMACEDVSLGTGLLDSLTDELNGWSAVNPFDQVDKAIKVFAADKELCDKYWNKALEILDSADKSEVVKAEKLHYLVYISPGKNTIDGKPEVAILETEGKMEDCIVYTFIRDGKKVDLAFSINDGFRPCVVDKIYVAPTPSKTTPTTTPPVEKTTPPVKTTKVTPSPTPKKTDTTVTDYTPTSTYNPVPTSTPTVPVPKDPARSPDFSKINPEAGGDRDDHGPGEMTIGDSDTWSTKENPDDSVHMTYSEQKEKYEKTKAAEPEVAKSPTASEPTPTPAPVPGTPPVDRFDNNEKEIDKETEGDPLVVKADGKEIDNSKPVTKTWGGLKGNED